MTNTTRKILQTQINTLFADNITGDISALDLRTQVLDLVDSLGVTYVSNTAPTANNDENNDGFAPGDAWFNTTTGYLHLCTDSANTAAIWLRQITANTAGGISISGNIAVTGTVDGRDLSVDGTKLDAIDQTLATTSSPTFAGLSINTDTLYVDAANDRIGINTNAPTVALDVNGNARIGTGALRLVDNSTLTPNVIFETSGRDYQIINNNGTHTLRTATDSATWSNVSRWSLADGHVLSNGAGTDIATITNTGFFGVNTTTPIYPLDVRGGASGISRLTGDTNATLIITSANTGLSRLYLGDPEDTLGGNLVYTNTTQELAMTSKGEIKIRPFETDVITANSTSVTVSTQFNLGQSIATRSTSATLSTLTQTAITTFTAGTYNSAKYVIQIKDAVSSAVQLTELLVVHNGTTASATEYGIIYTGASPIATFDVSLSGGTVSLLATGSVATQISYRMHEVLYKS